LETRVTKNLMNLFQLILKQMRQRALSTWLTLLSVLLGVGLATAVLLIYRGGGTMFGQTDFGYDVLIGPPKGSPLQLVMNTVYQIDQSPGVIPYQVYQDLLTKYRRNVKIAVPYAVGDSYKNHRIVGTLPKLFGFDDDGKPLEADRTLEYRVGKRYEIAEGHVFHSQKFEAVIGSDVTARTGLKMGDKFKATHGLPQPGETPDEHDVLWTVVGVLKKTYTAADRVLFIPLSSFYTIYEHEQTVQEINAERAGGAPRPPTKHAEEEPPFKMKEDGTFELLLPKEKWEVSAVLVRSRGSVDAFSLIRTFKIIDNRATAVNPATVMREFFDTFFKGSTFVLLMIALLVSIVASVGILVSIYNAVAARMREIAILRALGATRARILLLICLEAGLVGLFGGVLGLLVGHGIGAVGSTYMNRLLGQGFNWVTVSPLELLYLGVVVLIALLAGLVPALKAYQVPVATNLVAA
jgi:putative ABC transport system permease protein